MKTDNGGILKAESMPVQVKTIEQFDVIFQNIGYGITVQDHKGKLIYVNKEAARMAGFSSPQKMLLVTAEDILKKFTLMDKEGKNFPLDKMPGRYAAQDKNSHEALIHYKFNKSGKEYWSVVKAVPVLKGKEIEFIINTIRDVTVDMREEERRDYFIAIASHEFKTPLANIKAFTQVLERRLKLKKYDDIYPLLARIEIKVDELVNIINEFLDMSKIRAGRLELSYEIFDFNKLLAEIIKDFQQITPAHRIIKKGEVHKLVISDKQRIRQVIVNLLSNARKYSPLTDIIVVKVSQRKNFITVCVRDFGIGIPKIYLERIFEPFFRLQRLKNERISGLGIGLYIASQIVYLLGGRMWVKSELKAGSTFCFSLPYKPKKIKKKFVDIYKF
ncbi:PAS domain-containing sensor histidine kinase [Candidatus Roizmanbacteria bacterium]|nr:PAS domain-containing sensor histidine kinase [Candidatus Roizmanbacteria bacterium]